MVIFPNSKINIGLSIIGKREDGFHDIESVFYPVGLCDALEYLPVSEAVTGYQDTISYSGQFPVTGKDICIKLVELLRESFSFPTLRLHLHKKIPAGAGLGGGSSDAACLLKSFNSRFGFGLEEAQLAEYAGRIGSDCPFFINNIPSLVTGRGEKLQDIHLSLEGIFLILVYPGINASTAEAYKAVTPTHKSPSLQELVMETPEKWKDLIVNQFEVPVFKKFPAIKKIKEELYHMGAIYASMTGSGSAVYGLFRSEIEIADEFRDYFVHTEWLH
jgi:4-diphosphocytidyl-2-C-methyl-D-erythritol kinase